MFPLSWNLTSATITVSVSSSKLRLPFPELFRKLTWSISVKCEHFVNLPVYDVEQEDHEAEQGQHSIRVNSISVESRKKGDFQFHLNLSHPLTTYYTYPDTALVLRASPPSNPCLFHLNSGNLVK